MGKIRGTMKKGAAMLMTTAMLLGLTAAIPDKAVRVSAATDNKPSITAYATNDELMDYFTPGTDGTAYNVGKLVFGKNSEGNPQEWFILGQDSGVEGDNIDIFAVTSIAKDYKFNASYDSKTDSNMWADCTYPEGTAITKVYSNHYGASDFRTAVKQLAVNTDYFSFGEQDMMNPTTVTIFDSLNNMDYTVSDKLYPASNIDNNSKTIEIGSNDDKILNVNIYWGEEGNVNGFWLRTPYIWDKRSVECAFDGEWVGVCDTDTKGVEIRPAANIDLTEVSFASAVTPATSAASGTAQAGFIPKGSAMTLRLDGNRNGRNVGYLLYNNEKIIAEKDAHALGKVTLVVQGREGENDWYYTKEVAAQETVLLSDIRNELNLEDDISVSDCRIWLETEENGLLYAVNGVTRLIGIVNPDPVTGVANGVDIKELWSALPNEVNIKTEASFTAKADVDWDLENFVSGTYDKNIKTAQTFTEKGTVMLPDNVVNTDNISLEVTVTVTVEAKQVNKPSDNGNNNGNDNTGNTDNGSSDNGTGDNAPEAGDNNSLILYIASMLTALGTVAVIVRLKK